VVKAIQTAMLASLITCCLTSVTRADIIFELKNDPQPGEENIFFKTDQMGSTINGFTQQSDDKVVFHSGLNTLQDKSIGQAQIINTNGGNLNDIQVSVPGFTFTDFIVDLNKANNSVIDVTVSASDGMFPFEFTGKNGENFLTIIANNGETINSITYESTLGWETFKQPRISGLVPIIVPEPTSLLLLGTGVLGFAAVLRHRRGK
jgi:hypothetical protein